MKMINIVNEEKLSLLYFIYKNRNFFISFLNYIEKNKLKDFMALNDRFTQNEFEYVKRNVFKFYTKKGLASESKTDRDLAENINKVTELPFEYITKGKGKDFIELDLNRLSEITEEFFNRTLGHPLHKIKSLNRYIKIENEYEFDEDALLYTLTGKEEFKNINVNLYKNRILTKKDLENIKIKNKSYADELLMMYETVFEPLKRLENELPKLLTYLEQVVENLYEELETKESFREKYALLKRFLNEEGRDIKNTVFSRRGNQSIKKLYVKRLDLLQNVIVKLIEKTDIPENVISQKYAAVTGIDIRIGKSLSRYLRKMNELFNRIGKDMNILKQRMALESFRLDFVIDPEKDSTARQKEKEEKFVEFIGWNEDVFFELKQIKHITKDDTEDIFIEYKKKKEERVYVIDEETGNELKTSHAEGINAVAEALKTEKMIEEISRTWIQKYKEANPEFPLRKKFCRLAKECLEQGINVDEFYSINPLDVAQEKEKVLRQLPLYTKLKEEVPSDLIENVWKRVVNAF